MKKILLFTLLITGLLGYSQNPMEAPNGIVVGGTRSTMASSAIADIKSTTKGFLFPRMTTTQRNAIASPATSLVIFNTTTGAYNYYNGSAWAELGSTPDLSPYQLVSNLQNSLASSTTKYPTVSAVRIGLDGKEDSLPDQVGNAGKFLTTNGTVKSWATVGGATPTLQEVTDEGNETTNNIVFQGVAATGTIGSEYYTIFDNFSGESTYYSFSAILKNGVALNFPNKLTDTTLATTDDISFITVTANFTAENDLKYTANGTITVTDPTPITNKGYIVHVIGGTSTIGGVGYTTGALVYRYYNGTVWTSKNYGEGSGVATVTGTGVTGTPTDPIVNTPTATQVGALAIDGSNATGNINIGANTFFAELIKSGGNVVLTEASTTASLAPSPNRNYQTDIQQTNNDATSPIQGQIDGKQASLGFTPENVANKITGTLTTSTTSYPASSLVKSVTDANAANIATNTSNIATNTSNIALKANIASPTFTGIVTIPNGAVLGTPTSVNLANATFPTLNQNTTGSAASLSADIPQSRVTNLVTDLLGKQASLVSGTNIKTINGTTLLGSGDIVTTSTGVAGTLNVNTTAVGNIGTGEDDLITYSVGGNTLANNNDYLSFYNSGTFAGSLNSKRLKLKFGSNTIFDSGALSVTVSSDWSINGKIIRTSATTFKAVVSFTSSFGTLMGSADYVTGSETFSGNIILKATGEATANNDVLNELQLVCLNSQTTDALSSYMTKTANGSDISNIATFRANIGQDKITSVGNVNYTILPTDKVVATSATLTASRTWTLPAANAVNSGYEIIVADLFGGVTATNTLIVSRANADTINGTTTVTIAAPYAMRRFISDGVSKWTFDAGVMRISDYIGTTLTASKAVVTDSNSKLAPSTTTATEIGYVSGVTSAIQTQLDLKAVKSLSTYSLRVNNTNATADATETTYKALAQQTYSGTITWTGTTAPSGATTHTYNWVQVGNLVTLTINLVYAVAGSGLTLVAMNLPSDCPNPVYPTGISGASSVLYYGVGSLANNTQTAGIATAYLRRNSADTAFEMTLAQSSGSRRVAQITVQYYTL